MLQVIEILTEDTHISTYKCQKVSHNIDIVYPISYRVKNSQFVW